jgi:hypothetical protein
MYVQLCWPPAAGPAAVNGSYLNAWFPPLSVFAAREGPGVTRQLNLGPSNGSSNTADYTVQSLELPTSVTSGGWQWRPGSITTASEPLGFAAVNTSQTQHATYEAFLSGIVFGVAGGAFIGLILALIAPFASREDEPRGG